ncbi:phenylalanine--tRNA ligase subunit beta [Mucilaginibacter limnophilus]|uniref:Phenylalanine--tRNA ligase beta subunit n=1 Tax=Mucilaginibacter limnophilus TaxID=1932778 RepID=A0A437MRF0_9SPHI|nr:phenylalanine--tRNA ligase subunit beta [Mucilaginibacter limnophilus]RVU00212.1 phenylalanine--tRNA ligase subunit beta [Mucilaginibacter limnophilus]
MKISYNWLKQYIQTDKSPGEISQILTGIGLEVESLEKVQAVPGGLEGLLIGYVKECVDHANSDHLHVTKVDVGGAEDLQIVCGAANVAAGQKVVVATVGATLYPTGGEPFSIKKSKIRGEASEGMICAEDEIGLGASHEGIMVLDADAVVGTPAKDYFNLNDDCLYEIGLTPNRADAASHLGTARDIAAFLKINIVKPDVSAFKVDDTSGTVEVVVENTEAAPRYSGVSISGVEVKESPAWLKEKLAVIGVRPINNIVDVTNYVLHDLGQPLHAFDADRIAGNKVIVKTVTEGTSFKTLDDVERKLSANDLMICSAQEPMCIAGVFGGIGSGVTVETKNIFLESAYFNPVWVRKTAKRHGLKTDSSFRFERGTDPNNTVYALKCAALLIQEVAGGKITSNVIDIYPSPVEPFAVELSYKNTNRLIGKNIPHQEIKAIIEALDIEVVSETADGLSLKVPPYRVDVTREVDVIEEVLRIYGYNNIKIPTQIRASLNTSQRPERDTVQNLLSDLLTANGFNEILSNSLTKSAYSEDLDSAVKILNPLSSDLDVMRQSLLYSGLEAIAYNQKRKSADLKLYEFGKVYSIAEDKYNEVQRFSVFISGAVQGEQWNAKPKQASFYNIKAIVDGILQKLNVKDFTVADAEGTELSYGLQYNRGNKTLVKFGAVAATALKKADVDKEVFYADFNFDTLLTIARKNKIVYKEVSKFPSVRRDLSMLVDKAVTFEQIKQIAQKTERKLLQDVNVFDVYEGDKLPAGKKSYAVSFVLQDAEKTLTDKAIDAIMQKLIFNLGKEAGAEIRK